MALKYLFIILACFTLSGFLLYQSATIVPFISELEVITGRLVSIQENEFDGMQTIQDIQDIRYIQSNGGLIIHLHRHPAAFQYYSSLTDDYAYLQEQLAVGDNITIWAAPIAKEQKYSIWRLQKGDEVLLSYDYVCSSNDMQRYFFVGGLAFLWCGFLIIYYGRRRRQAATRNPYAL